MQNLKPPAGIILAAGLGRRFNAGKADDAKDRENKLLAQLPNGEPILLQSIRALQAVLPEVWVVLREHDHEKQRDSQQDSERESNVTLRTLVESTGAKIVTVSSSNKSMGESIAAGVSATPHALGWLISLGDMPYIQPATLQKITARIIERPQQHQLILAPSYRGQRGHPVFFGSGHLKALLALSHREEAGDGAKALMQNHAVCLLDVDDPGIHADIDTRED